MTRLVPDVPTRYLGLLSFGGLLLLAYQAAVEAIAFISNNSWDTSTYQVRIGNYRHLVLSPWFVRTKTSPVSSLSYC